MFSNSTQIHHIHIFRLQYDPEKFIRLWLGLSSEFLGKYSSLTTVQLNTNMKFVPKEMRYKSFDFIRDSMYKVAKVDLHPKFEHRDEYDKHDIAIMRLSEPVSRSFFSFNRETDKVAAGVQGTQHPGHQSADSGDTPENRGRQEGHGGRKVHSNMDPL